MRNNIFKSLLIFIGVVIFYYLTYKMFNYEPLLGFLVLLILAILVIFVPFEKLFK